jgi:acetyl/propionyl-CoA carboxylase alpha subunit
VRVDTGVLAGCSVQPFYDSMMAKLLVHGRDRTQTLARARRALGELEIEGVSTTQALHRSLLDWPGLAEATAHTQALEAFLEDGDAALALTTDACTALAPTRR